MTIAFQRHPAALLGLIVLFLLIAAGCAQKEEASPATAPPADTAASPKPSVPAGPLKVALVTPGPISDKGWNAAANEGLQHIARDLGAQTSPPVEGPAPAEIEGVLRRLAEDGNHLVFIHASEYDEAARRVAASFPKTVFAVAGGRSAGPNLVPIRFEAGLAAPYLAGMLAAGMSKSGKLGCVGPQQIPIIRDCFRAFERGAKAVRPDVVVRVTWTGNETDIGKGRQQAQALLDAGVDVLVHNANAAGQGVFQAVASRPGALVIGANIDQSDQATAQNLGSFVLGVPDAYLAVARLVRDGEVPGGKPFVVGLDREGVGLHYNPGFRGTIPADLKAKIEQARKDLLAGKINPAG